MSFDAIDGFKLSEDLPLFDSCMACTRFQTLNIQLTAYRVNAAQPELIAVNLGSPELGDGFWQMNESEPYIFEIQTPLNVPNFNSIVIYMQTDDYFPSASVSGMPVSQTRTIVLSGIKGSFSIAGTFNNLAVSLNVKGIMNLTLGQGVVFLLYIHNIGTASNRQVDNSKTTGASYVDSINVKNVSFKTLIFLS